MLTESSYSSLQILVDFVCRFCESAKNPGTAPVLRDSVILQHWGLKGPEIYCSWYEKLHSFGHCLERDLKDPSGTRLPCHRPDKVDHLVCLSILLRLINRLAAKIRRHSHQQCIIFFQTTTVSLRQPAISITKRPSSTFETYFGLSQKFCISIVQYGRFNSVHALISQSGSSSCYWNGLQNNLYQSTYNRLKRTANLLYWC